MDSSQPTEDRTSSSSLQNNTDPASISQWNFVGGQNDQSIAGVSQTQPFTSPVASGPRDGGAIVTHRESMNTDTLSTPYSDQIIDRSTGMISAEKLRHAFSQLCAILDLNHSWTVGQTAANEATIQKSNEDVLKVQPDMGMDGEMSEVSDEDEEDASNIVSSVIENIPTNLQKEASLLSNEAFSSPGPHELRHGDSHQLSLLADSLPPVVPCAVEQHDRAISAVNNIRIRRTSCGDIALHPVRIPLPSELTTDLLGTPVAEGKLALILDLDNTLLHAQAQANLGCEIEMSDYLDEDGNPEIFKFDLPCNRKPYYLKFRPQLRIFLEILANYYELSIYTNATKEYADLVLSILDRDRKVFGDRIVARDGKTRGAEFEKKYVCRLYPDLDHRVIVAFDDRQDIWMDLPQRQVLKAQHYEFFEGAKSELAKYYPAVGCLPIQSLQAQSQNPRDLDDHLFYLAEVFLDLHKQFFANVGKADVGHILEGKGKSILSGVGVFFTGFRKTAVPGVSVPDCEERQVELAQSLGAKVYKRYDEVGVTHVVAAKNNTNNFLACRDASHLKKVHTLWLYHSEACWKKAAEDTFDVEKICQYYDNLYPPAPYRDHWIHAHDGEAPSRSLQNQVKTPSPLPVREFPCCCAAGDGANLYSPFEKVVLKYNESSA